MRQVVVTGVGVVCPIGIGRQDFWDALLAGKNGVFPLETFYESRLPSRIAGQVLDFEPKAYIRPRKSLKVMSREIQLAYAAADLAWQDANLPEEPADPERTGVVCGCDMLYSDPNELTAVYQRCLESGTFDFGDWGEKGMRELNPLWLLKYLPNMPACHIGIFRDARGPCNSSVLGDASSLLAIDEATRVIARGTADVMLTGGTGSRLHPSSLVWRGDSRVSHRNDDPEAASRPFDAERDGMVNGEGAAIFVLEEKQHALRRGAKPLARIVGTGKVFSPPQSDNPPVAASLQRALTAVMKRVNWQPSKVGHVNSHGLSTVHDDVEEAKAIQATVGDVPVSAFKGHFGNLGAGGGAVELAGTLLALEAGVIPATRNCAQLDAACPIDLVVNEPREINSPRAISASYSRLGQAVALAVEKM